MFLDMFRNSFVDSFITYAIVFIIFSLLIYPLPIFRKRKLQPTTPMHSRLSFQIVWAFSYMLIMSILHLVLQRLYLR